jgi:molecular chaperone GrpE
VTGHYDEAGQHAAPEEPLVVRDRRRIDPETGEVRVPAHAAEPEAPVGSGGPSSGPSLGDSLMEDSVEATSGVEEILADLERQLAERTADLQRVQAEYANYRKRIERDRVVVVDSAKASLVTDLLPLLDDLERAERHGDLTGAFKAVGDKLFSSLQRSGLEAFGGEGEPFDPSVHEAVQHNTSPDVAGPTVTVVMRAGYKFGERVLRPALVGVTDHEPGAAPLDSPVEGELPIDAEIVDENTQQ